MIHTATLTFSPSKELYKQFIQSEHTTWNSEDKCYQNLYFRNNGIAIRAFFHQSKTWKSYYFSARINLKRFVNQDNHTLLFSENDADAVINKFNSIMDQIVPSMPRFADWTVMRIDYAKNAYTENVGMYIRLLRKGFIPAHVHIPYTENRNYTQRFGSLYLTGKSITINFYDKQAQIKHEQRTNEAITAKMISDASNLLRFEVQVHKSRVNYLKYIHHFECSSVLFYLDDEIATKTILRELNRVIPDAPFVKRSEAAQKVLDQSCSHKKKQQMLCIIDMTAKQHASLTKTKKYLISNKIMSEAQFSDCIKRFMQLGINPIVLSDNGKIERLPSAQTLFAQ